MIIRRASAEDSPGIALAHVSSWQHAYCGIVPQSHLDHLSDEKAIRFYERVGFALARGSAVTVEIGGARLPEVRYEIAIA